ncbi:MAG: bifunctional glycosyltransferase/class I SAM-dependent methyltransferase [Candidatus Obscuribacterales bacterium]
MSAKDSKLSILIPVYNERRTLRTLMRRVLESPIQIPFEVIAVDDCSRDGSREILAELAAEDSRIKVILHAENTGKGGAIHTAIAAMTGNIALVQDADLEYDPGEIPKVIAPILDGRADASFGSRYAGRDCRRVLYYLHSVMNKTLTWLTNIVTDLDLTDMETCYKAVRADILKQTPLKMKRFGIEPELTVRLAQWGARIYEVPISYSGRTYAEGKKITWKDGVQALLVIFWAALIDRKFTTHDGYYHLKAVRGPGINRWMFETIKPFVGNDVLEAGCGIGNLSEMMLNKSSLTCADVDPLFVELISRRFAHLENFTAIQHDITEPLGGKIKHAPDTVICLNVLELVENDVSTLKNFYDVLLPGGNLILMVPQHAGLFSKLDKRFGHLRRYDREALKKALADAGFEVRTLQDFNRLGFMGWFIFSKLLQEKELPTSMMWIFNRSLPVAKQVDYLKFLPGVSLVAVARKPDSLESLTTSPAPSSAAGSEASS